MFEKYFWEGLPSFAHLLFLLGYASHCICFVVVQMHALSQEMLFVVAHLVKEALACHDVLVALNLHSYCLEA